MKNHASFPFILALLILAWIFFTFAPRSHGAEMPALPAIESALTNSPASWLDNVGVDAGIFVSTKSINLKSSLLAGLVTYQTTSNTFLALGGFYGLKERGGAEVVGGLKSSSVVRIPFTQVNLRTVQWIADGVVYVSGASGGTAYGVTVPAQHRFENYAAAAVVVQVGTRGRIGVSTLIIGTDAYVGVGGGITF